MKSLAATGQSLIIRWLDSGTHSTEDQFRFQQINRRMGDLSMELSRMVLDSGLAATTFFVNLLEPVSMNGDEKIECSLRIREHLRLRETNFPPRVTTILDDIEKLTRELSGFVDSRVQTSNFETEIEFEVDAKEDSTKNLAKQGVLDDENQLGEGPVRICLRDEFLDNSAYRQIALTLLERTMIPAGSLLLQLASLRTLQRQSHEKYSKWRTDAAHSVDDLQRLTKKFNATTMLTRANTSLMKELASKTRQANKDFDSSVDLDPSSAVSALQELTNRRMALMNEYSPKIQSGFAQSSAIANEIIQIIDEASEVPMIRKSRPFWRRLS